MTTRTNRIDEIFADARELQTDALEILAPGKVRNAAEKARGRRSARPTPFGESQGGASLPEAEAAVRVLQGALPGAGKERRTSGAAVRARQPADDGGPAGELTWAECALRQSRPGPAARGKPPTALRGRNGRANIGKTAPKGKKFRGNSHGNRQKSRGHSCSENP